MTDNSNFVDVNTDNLDDFSALMAGTKQVAPAPEPELEAETPSAVEDESNIEDDTLANEESDEGNELVDSDEDDDTKLQIKPKKKTVQERINELTAKAREAERREADLLRRLEEMAAPKQEVKEPVQKTESGLPTPDDLDGDGEPKYALGEFDPKYIADLTRATIQAETAKAREQARLEQEQEQVNAATTALHTEWAGKLEQAQTEYPDLLVKGAELESTFSNLDDQYGNYLATTIMTLSNGPDVLYYLSNNTDEAKQIVAAGAVKATIALGELNALFKKNGTPPKPKVSSAPTPPPSNKGNKARMTIPADTDDLDAFSEMFYKKK